MIKFIKANLKLNHNQSLKKKEISTYTSTANQSGNKP